MGNTQFSRWRERMRLKRNQLRDAIVVALLAGTTMTAGSALAQEEGQQPQQRATELDAITVTGTRIQSQTVTASAPIAEITAEEFKYSGTTRVEDLLNQFPQMSPGFDAFTVNPTTGYPTADLRGLGSNRTLVLVNGHRLPPGGIRSEARDLNQVPAALVKRVDVLTGGASAVYGSDAMAGVVNFVLDTEFEGFSANIGYSGYQHKNDNAYIQGLMDEVGFEYPSGSTSLDGVARTFDMAVGSRFADGRGHAMAWVTYRENDELRQGARDYSSCALNASGTACGGSGTSPIPNFLIIGATDENGEPFSGYGHQDQTTGEWLAGSAPPYNYAPINHYQRPDERYTFGTSIKFEVNEHFRPYIDAMFANTNTSVQIAESGTFFVNSPLSCDDDLAADLGAVEQRPLVAVLDYGIGNVHSARKALEKMGSDARLTDDPELIAAADGVVLPGVGAFGACMNALRATGLETPARDAVASGRPFLGICVGMQMLFDGSEENADARGLGVIPGTIRWIPPGVKRPQMQWNRLDRRPGSALLADTPHTRPVPVTGTASGSSRYPPTMNREIFRAITPTAVST